MIKVGATEYKSLTEYVRSADSNTEGFRDVGMAILDQVTSAVLHPETGLSDSVAQLDDLRRATLSLIEKNHAAQQSRDAQARRDMTTNDLGLRGEVRERFDNLTLSEFATHQGIGVSRYHDVMRQDTLKHAVRVSGAEKAEFRAAPPADLQSVQRFADEVLRSMSRVAGLALGGPIGAALAGAARVAGGVKVALDQDAEVTPADRRHIAHELGDLKSRLMDVRTQDGPTSWVLANRTVQYFEFLPASMMHRQDRVGRPIMWGTCIPRTIYSSEVDGERGIRAIHHPQVVIPA